MASFRVEKDTLGEVKVPRDKYFGAQTQRAVENFPISGLRLQEAFVRAQAIIKKSAARANMRAGVLDDRVGKAIMKAADEVIAGKFSDEFVVDVYQAGAGTSQNMNINEVLANRAEEILGGKRGRYKHVHPNDHVNMAQSTNDTIHTAIHVASVLETNDKLFPSVKLLEKQLENKAKEFDGIVKCGRTHLQDAVPIRMGQVFRAYASMVMSAARVVQRSLEDLRALPIGGTAVGTGLNTPPGYRDNVIEYISEETGEDFTSSEDMIEAMSSMGAVVEFSGSLRVLATNLKKIADDFRLLSSGPRTGLGELELPAVQPGSSIMPGKVNPVIAEMLNMVAFQVFGCDATVVQASQAGQLELNVMMPVIAYNLLHSIRILSTSMQVFSSKCVRGVRADAETCMLYAQKSAALATALSPVIGYDKAAALAKEALKKNLLLRDLVAAKKIITRDQLDELLDIRAMTEGFTLGRRKKPGNRSSTAKKAGSRSRSK